MSKREGSTCMWCGEPILEGEPLGPFHHTLMHYECAMRSVVGGANHLLKFCSCPGCAGTEPPDPPEMTRREAARWACKVFGWVRELGLLMAMDRATKKPPEGGL